MKRFDIRVATLALSALVTPAAAGDFDGTKPLICAAVEANDCAMGANCIKGLAEDINVPQFVRISFSDNTITARGRTTAIRSHSRADGVLVIHGFENRRAWSIAISEASGKLVGAIAGDEEGFLIFGACTPL